MSRIGLHEIASPGAQMKLEELKDEDAALTYSDQNADLVFEIERRWQQATRLWAWAVKHRGVSPMDPELRTLLNRLAARHSIFQQKGKYQLFMQTSVELDRFIKDASECGFQG